ncbi:hypothetical protein LguiA_006532 [Lonicera macranthoides]
MLSLAEDLHSYKPKSSYHPNQRFPHKYWYYSHIETLVHLIFVGCYTPLRQTPQLQNYCFALPHLSYIEYCLAVKKKLCLRPQ